MGDRNVVNPGTNFDRLPLELRVAHFGGPASSERHFENPQRGGPQGQDAFGLEFAAQCGTGLDLDSAAISTVLGSETLCHHMSGGDTSQRAGSLGPSSIHAASTGLLMVSGLPLRA